LCILILHFLTADKMTKGSGLNGSKHYPITLVPKYWNCATFSKDLLANLLLYQIFCFSCAS
jgi:hypothetical protein